MLRIWSTLLFLAALALCKDCEIGEIWANSRCLSCQDIANTAAADQGSNKLTYLRQNQCPCQRGFTWISPLAQCRVIPTPKGNRIFFPSQNNSTSNVVSDQLAPRILQTTTCNTAGGFIPYTLLAYQYNTPTVCYNCRLLPYGLTAASSSTCSCQTGFAYYSPWAVCYCYAGMYIDPASGRCLGCASMGALMSQCKSCTSPFVLTLLGCIYMPTLPRGGNGQCATGYAIRFSSSACYCNYNIRYAITSSGVCALCASGDNNCINCRNNYFFDGIQCVHGSLIPNYDFTTSYACRAGHTQKKNPFNNQVVSCACSFAAQYYQSGANCISCTASLPSGVTLANCQACSPSAKFYKGSVECIYCPGVYLAVGTATINGCDCPANYFWNANTDKCECDFALGFIGGAIATCINCSSIANTDQVPLPDACSCLPGFKWNAEANTCDCNTLSPSIFSVAGACVNCATMPGASGSVIGGASCECLVGFYWNPVLKKCACDPSQNFAMIGGFCTDCRDAVMSNGLANAFGCVCKNGFSWNLALGKCVCPSGSVIIGTNCLACALASLPSGAVAADCSACSNAKGFASHSLGCISCSSQTGANTAVTSGVCTCAGTGMAWRPNIGACACDWSRYYYTRFNSGGYSCFLCSQMPLNPEKCRCDISYALLDPINYICTIAAYDPNGSGFNSAFSCNTGYFWSQGSLPYKCIAGYGAFSGYYSSSTVSYTSCASSNNAALCALCDTASGYLLVSANSQCLLCSTVTGSTAAATINGCVCNTGRSWNGVTLTCDSITCPTGTIYNSALKTCGCDPLRSVTVGSNCVSCPSVTNSNGYAASTNACGCISPNVWVVSASTGVCTTATANACNPVAQLSIAGGCFTCPSSNGGTGAVDGSGCGCATNFIWSPTASGGSCLCDYSKAYQSGTACTACPVGTTGGDGKGGCTCSGTSSWSGSACLRCNTLANVVLLASGSCFTCGTAGTYTVAKLVSTTNSTCTCTPATPKALTWNPNGSCDCGTTAALIVNANSLTCFTCANATAFTSAKATSTTCSCASSNLRWNQARLACDCSHLANSIVFGTGAAAQCVTCTPSVYMVGTSADRTVCVCIGRLLWNRAGNTCGCTNPLTTIIGGTGADTQCITCSSIRYGGVVVSPTSCSCRGTGLVFNSSAGGSCNCPAANIILPSFTCSPCPAGSTTYTAYECLCPPGFIWNRLQSCIQCGSSAIPNSLASGGTSFACMCSVGFFWDVMTLSCVSSTTCVASSPSCMKCPGGATAVALSAAAAKNLGGGAAVQVLLNGTFTNYNRIKGYQCPCASGSSWDSFRLSCYATGLL